MFSNLIAIIVTGFLLTGMFSCSNPRDTGKEKGRGAATVPSAGGGSEVPANAGSTDARVKGTDTPNETHTGLRGLALDSPKDLACGMPIRAGLEDTAHYGGKLYGFCSKECKDAFLKAPATYLAGIK